MKKKLLAVGLGLIMAFSMVGCGGDSDKNENPEPTEEAVEAKQLSDISLNFADGYAKVTENSRFELMINEDGSSIRVRDKDTQEVWDSVASADGFNLDDVNAKWQQKMQSPFEIFYTDLDKGYGSVINLSLMELDYSVDMVGIENGVRVSYILEQSGITVALDYSLDEHGLNVEVPLDGIKEEGNYAITALKVFPYFADATDTADGYYFYPDGSGAIMEFNDNSHISEAELVLKLFGDLTVYKNTLDVLDQQESEVMLPVFGANINGNGFLAIIEEGYEAASIKVSPTSQVVKINSISTEFTFRRSFVDNRIAGEGVLTFDEEIIPCNRKISYRFFEKGETTYSDMAVAYREYLTEELGVEPKVEQDSIPTSLDLFMGIKEEGLLYDEFKVVTTFEQAQEIIDRMSKEGVHSLEIQLKGWTKDGYGMEPVMFPVNSKVGGSKGLKELLEYAKNKDVKIILEANFLEAKAEAGGFSQRDDVIYLGNKTLFSNFDETLFLMSPTTAKENLEQFIEDSEDYEISGISFYSMGQYLLYNYNSDDTVTATQCMKIWQDMMQMSRDSYGKTVVQGGNSYALTVADKVTDIPYEDSGYQITTKSVPFYQIALHGLVEMTGQAGNLSSDMDREKLKWVEYGYTPYFELTYSGSEGLMYTDYNTLFSSTYTDWLEIAAEINSEFNENLKDVWTSYIVDHEELQDEVYKVTYDNGIVIYVNYNDKDVTVDNVEVKAEDYTVKRG